MFEIIYSNLGGLFIALIAVILGYWAIRSNRKLEEQKLKFEEKKFQAEEKERETISKFREQEYRRFSQPASDLAEQLAQRLIDDPYWAFRAIEAAKLLSYRDTLFGERTQHFKEEKEELASRFTPYLFKRCEAIVEDGKRHVYLFIDAGTTLFPFFRIIGQETAKLWQRKSEWLNNFHLITNNLPGIDQLMQTGRQTQYGRYSKLAISDCQLLPGEPLPIFASVAGELTNKTIYDIREKALNDNDTNQPIFIALVVGNWIRIRRTRPRCPVPMARGIEHLQVKDALINNADEVFVISPLGKVFVNQTNAAVNEALGFSSPSKDLEKASYDELSITNDQASKVKLISTTRSGNRILQRHSNRLEDALADNFKREIDEDLFANSKIADLPHLLFPFTKLPGNSFEEFEIEFPHFHTRTKQKLLDMFSVDLLEKDLNPEN